MTKQSKMFAALLKYWRGKRGLSQLDLALRAEISTRHISFLETGRSQPSQEMVLRLAEALDLPLREQNKLLVEAGFAPIFAESDLKALADPKIDRALKLMMEQHEPYPMMVMDRSYNLLQMNRAARRFVVTCIGPQEGPVNVMMALFEKHLFRPYIEDWDSMAREVLSRLQREVLHKPNDEALSTLLDSILNLPEIPEAWRIPDLSRGGEAVYPIRFSVREQTLEFITTITSFNTPKNVTLEELQIESYYPTNPETEGLCHQLFSDEAQD